MEKETFTIDEFTQKSLEIEFKPLHPDLSKCYKGQKLLCRNGLIIYYNSPLGKYDLYDHEIYYDEEMTKDGTRCNNGWVLRGGESENDVIEILE